MNPNLANLLSDTAAEKPDSIAIRLDDVAVPYGALDLSLIHI